MHSMQLGTKQLLIKAHSNYTNVYLTSCHIHDIRYFEGDVFRLPR